MTIRACFCYFRDDGESEGLFKIIPNDTTFLQLMYLMEEVYESNNFDVSFEVGEGIVIPEDILNKHMIVIPNVSERPFYIRSDMVRHLKNIKINDPNILQTYIETARYFGIDIDDCMRK